MALEGVQLGQYRLMSLLGMGGMGEVYLAEETQVGRQVAIKVSRTEASSYPDNVTSKDSVRLFQREAKMIARLDHPHILPLFNFGEQQVKGMTLTYIVMPYRPEGAFNDWLKQRNSRNQRGLLSPQDVAYFIAQAADALQYAHDKQIVHQDVKPANFLIRSRRDDLDHPDLLLADFGIARLNSATASVSHNSRGTPLYMAPEQWSGEPVPATDQYALAAVAHELLTGRPCVSGNQAQMMYQHLSVSPKAPSSLNMTLPKAVDVVILRALSKNPADRYPSILDFSRALQQAVVSASAPVQPVPQPLVSPSPTTPAEDLRSTLVISSAEARQGTSRTLTLPGGSKVHVSVPVGAYDRQILRVPSDTGNLVVKLEVVKAEDQQLTVIKNDDEKTSLTPPPASNTLRKEPEPTQYVLPPKQSESTQYAPPPEQIQPASIPFPDSNRERAPRKGSPPRTLILIGLILVVVLISSIFIYRSNMPQTTAAPQSTSGNTPQPTTTLQSIVNNTLNPYPPQTGTLAFSQNFNNTSSDWTLLPNQCTFTNSNFTVYTSLSSSIFACSRTGVFADFAFEAQMRMTQGDCGGLEFRSNYFFEVCQDGTYGLVNNGNDPPVSLISHQHNGSIKTGLNQTNTIAVVANGSQIDLYVNGQKINSFPDTSSNYYHYSSGQVGLVAEGLSNPTQVVYTNIRLWKI